MEKMNYFFFAILFLPITHSYKFYYKNSENDESFGYSPKLICNVNIIDNWFYVSFENFSMQQQSPQSKLINVNERKIVNCFQYNRESYFIFKKSNTIEIFSQNKLLNFKIKFDFIRFDNLDQKLYFLDTFFLYQIDLNKLEYLFNQTDLNNINQLNYTHVDTLSDRINDIIIINSGLYYITKNGQIISKWIGKRHLKFSTKTNMTKFYFIPINNPDLFMSNNIISLISRQKPEFVNGNLYLFLLYVIDLIFLLIILYLLNKKNAESEKELIYPPLIKV